MRVAFCKIRRTNPPLPQTHGGQTFQMSPMRALLQSFRSFSFAHEATCLKRPTSLLHHCQLPLVYIEEKILVWVPSVYMRMPYLEFRCEKNVWYVAGKIHNKKNQERIVGCERIPNIFSFRGSLCIVFRAFSIKSFQKKRVAINKKIERDTKSIHVYVSFTRNSIKWIFRTLLGCRQVPRMYWTVKKEGIC